MKKTRAAWKGADGSTAPKYRIFSYAEAGEAVAHIKAYNRVKTRAGRGNNYTYNDILCSADTETSKTGPAKYNGKGEYIAQENIVVAWTFSARCEAGNICTVYGARPSDFVRFLEMVKAELCGERLFIFFHNLAYDWTFLELFLFARFGFPVNQLNTKPHYPISIEFGNGITLRDSLIIAQTKLEKWADDLDVEHKKAVGKWDYDRIRDQRGEFTEDELQYIEQDTLALVECLDKIMRQLRKHVYSIPLTCTGILREVVRTEGRKHNARDRFLRLAPSFELYNKLSLGYHGGYTHNNRHAAGWIWPDKEARDRGEFPTCYDFASSYPHRMLVDKMPCERFRHVPDIMTRKEILRASEDTAFLFTFHAFGIVLKDPMEPMPYLQRSKCIYVSDVATDNGRILYAGEVSIVLTEIDLRIIDRQYKMIKHECTDVWLAGKRLLPKWYRDIVYKCFADKCILKKGDKVAYNLAKAKLNSLYGLTVCRSIREEISEVYEDQGDDIKQGSFITKSQNAKEAYQKYLDNNNTILSYAWGVWVTAYAAEALFDLGSCVRDRDTKKYGKADSGGIWLYSDTDSVYACGWDEEKLRAYNEKQIERLKKAGYGPVIVGDRKYYTGVAELDGEYLEFKGLHSKCYAVRLKKPEENKDGSLKLGPDGKPIDIKITIAGVPKSGQSVLNHSLDNFYTSTRDQPGTIFPGSVTGKLTHYYIYRPEIYIDERGIEYGNSIDLNTCDYEISPPTIEDFLKLIEREDVFLQVYDEE